MSEPTSQLWESILREKFGYPVGRNEEPDVLVEAWMAGRFEGRLDDLAVAVSSAWIGAEYPSLSLDAFTWFLLFDQTGFIRNGLRQRRPRRPARLFRACAPSFELGMSWTDDYATAVEYHRRAIARGLPSHVITITNADEWMPMARFSAGYGRNEQEWLVVPNENADYEPDEVVPLTDPRETADAS